MSRCNSRIKLKEKTITDTLKFKHSKSMKQEQDNLNLRKLQKCKTLSSLNLGGKLIGLQEFNNLDLNTLKNSQSKDYGNLYSNRYKYNKKELAHKNNGT